MMVKMPDRKKMVKELVDEIEELLVEEGPLHEIEVHKRTSYGYRYTSYAYHEGPFVKDDSDRVHLRDGE